MTFAMDTFATLQLTNEEDVILARQRIREAAETIGFDRADQIRIATAISDAARLAFQRCARGAGLEMGTGRWGEEPALLVRLRELAGEAPALGALFDRSAGDPSPEARSVHRLVDHVEVLSPSEVLLVKLLPARIAAMPRPELVRLATGSGGSPRSFYEELRLQGQELLRALEQLRAREEELTAFSYSIAHDLRGPLRAIRGFSGVLEEDYGEELAEGARENLAFINAAALRMGALIDGLLALFRLTGADIHREALDLADLFRARLAELRAAEPERRVETTVQESLRAFGDPRLLRLVIDNLLDNAWKFTARNPHARIDVDRRDTERGPAFCVSDNGVGFAMEPSGRLFGPFQRFHSSEEFPGTGLGLTTVSRVVVRHGGAVWAEAAVGRGATFFFQLAEES
jgi:signal transduction histidine kinase